MTKDEVVGAAPVGVLTSRGAAAPLSPPASLKPHPPGHHHLTRDGRRRLRTAATPILVLALLLPLLLLSDGVCGQRQQRRQAKQEAPRKPAKAKTITDLFNTSSCADPPFKCPYPRIEFYLYTRATQDNPEKLDLLLDAGPALLNTHYDASNPTKVVIHGFGGGRKLSPSPDMRKAYFTRGEYNVIIVDYSSLVVEPCLSQVEWAPRFCALCIAQLIGWLDDAWIWSGGPSLAAPNRVARNADPQAPRRGRHFNDQRIVIDDEFNPADFGGEEEGSFGQRVAPTTQAPRRDHGRSSERKVVPAAAPRRLRVVGSPPEAVHVIGYSVGAHIAGLLANYVGERRIGRITGLDPTIIFYMGNNRSRDLDPSDALFVDVIHTGAGVLGQWGPNGHVDFYVNGGTSQPGCTGGIYETLACDHQKVTPYFIESITSQRGFWATPCPNLVLYLIGWCTTNDKSKLIKMGEDVPHSARGIYYLETNARRPYAKGLPGDSNRRKRQGRG